MPAVGFAAIAYYATAGTAVAWVGTVAAVAAIGYEAVNSLAPSMPEMGSSPTYRANTVYNTSEEDVMVSRLYGKCNVGGNKLRYNDPDDSDTRVIIGHCQGPVEGAVSYEVNGIAWGDLDGSHTKSEYTGTRTQAADGRFAVKASAYRSMAYTAFTFDKNDQQVGYDPNVTVIMEGLLCDPLAGGAAVHTRNPAVIMVDWLINVDGYAIGDLDITEFQSLEELCDEVPTGGTLPRYRLDYNFDADISVNDAKKLIWQSFNGCTTMSQGKIKPLWDSAQMSDGAGSLTAKTVSHAFDEDNIVKGSLKRKKPEKYNIVRIHYKDSANEYKDSSVEIKDEYSISINGELPYSEQCYYITDAELARRRAKYKFNKAKYTDYECTLDAFSGAGDLEPYDLVSVTHSKPGWTTKEFLVASISEGESGQVRVVLRAYYSGVYDDSELAEQLSYRSNLPNPYETPTTNSAVVLSLSSPGTGFDYDAVTVAVTIPTTDPFYSYTEIHLSKDDATYVLAGTTSGEDYIYQGMGSLYVPGDTVYVRTINVNELGVKSAMPGAAEDSIVITSSIRLGSFYAGLYDLWGGNAAIGNAATTIVLGNLDGTPKMALGASADAMTLANFGTYPGFYVDGTGSFRGGNATAYLQWNVGSGELTIEGAIIAASSNLAGTISDTFTINSDLDDVTTQLILGRTTGGNATLGWDGSVISLDKSLTLDSTGSVTFTCDMGADTSAASLRMDIAGVGRGQILYDPFSGNPTSDQIKYYIGDTSSAKITMYASGNLSLGNSGTAELIAGSINRASGTLTLEIGGTPEISISSASTTFGGNLVIPDGGYINSASATAIQIEADGDVVLSQDLYVNGGNIILPSAGEINTASGNLTLNPGPGGDVIISDNLYVNGGNIILPSAGEINTSAGDLIILPVGDITLDPTGNNVFLTSAVTLETDNFVSQTTGWSVSYAGLADFRGIYADELIVKAFTAEVYSALAGGIIISKSRAEVTRDFTIPNTAATATLYVSDLEGIADTAVFVAGDYIRLRVLDYSGGGLVVADVYGTVSAYSNLSGGEQSWTFTTTTTGYSSADVIYTGSVALDYGQTGSGSTGVWEVTVLDPAGNPYSQVQTWDTVTAGEPDNFTTHVRTGNLDGLSGVGLEYGLYAGQGLTTSDSYVLVTDSQVDLHNIPLTFHDGANNTVLIDPTVPSLAIGATVPTDYLTGDGFWVGNDSGTYKFHLGDVDGEVLAWDGAAIYLGVIASEHIELDGSTIQFMNGATKMAELSGTTWILGDTTYEHLEITATYLQLKDGATTYTTLTNGELYLGNTSSGEYIVINATDGIRMYGNAIKYTQLTNAGVLYLGNEAVEHVKVSSTGTQIYDGAVLYATYGATTTIGLTASEHVSISSTAVQLKDGATVYTDLTAGVLSLGDTSNEHVLVNTSGMTIYDGATTLAQFGSTVYIGDYTTADEFIQIDSSGIEITSGGTKVIDIDSSGVGTISLLAGGNITLTGHDTTWAGITWEGSTYSTEVYSTASGADIFIVPDTDDSVTFSFGSATNYFEDIVILGRSTTLTRAQYDADDYASFFAQAGNGTSKLQLQMSSATTAQYLEFDGVSFLPGFDSVTSLGTATKCFTNVYADAGVTSCSDKKFKKEIQQETLGLDFINSIVPVMWQWNARKNNSNDKVFHGFLAQEIEQALIENNIDPDKFGGISKAKDDDGLDRYGLIIEQLIAPIVKSIQELSAKLS